MPGLMDGLDIFIFLWKPDATIFDTHSPSSVRKIKAKHEYVIRKSKFFVIKEKP